MLRSLFLTFAMLAAVETVAGSSIESLLASEPVAEAERAFAAGDLRNIVVPVCGSQPGEVIPGWPLNETPEVWKAIENGRRPVTCADLGNKPGTKEFIRLVKYAEVYNRRMIELIQRRGK